MKEFACGAVVPGCEAQFHAETEDELMGQIAVHAKEEHGIDEVSPELAAQVREQIRES